MLLAELQSAIRQVARPVVRRWLIRTKFTLVLAAGIIAALNYGCLWLAEKSGLRKTHSNRLHGADMEAPTSGPFEFCHQSLHPIYVCSAEWDVRSV